VGAQLMIAPVEGWSAYINVLSGYHAGGGYGSGTIVDLTTAYQVTEKFKLGLNAADYSAADDNGGYTGAALYPQYAFSPAVSLGLRGEYFNYKGAGTDDDGIAIPNKAVTAITVSGNLKAGGLTFIPEVRFDSDEDFTQSFMKSSGALTKTAAQFSLAAVYAF
ncbi:MAG: porin, partial [Pedobacter sp.]